MWFMRQRQLLLRRQQRAVASLSQPTLSHHHPTTPIPLGWRVASRLQQPSIANSNLPTASRHITFGSRPDVLDKPLPLLEHRQDAFGLLGAHVAMFLHCATQHTRTQHTTSTDHSTETQNGARQIGESTTSTKTTHVHLILSTVLRGFAHLQDLR